MATDVAAPFPQVDLQPGSVVTVTLSDPGALITALNIHGYQDDSVNATPTPLSPVRGAYTTA
jgi:hypothetical protein